MREDVIAWLKQWDIRILIADPAARMWRGLVDFEGNNIAIDTFTAAIDEIKERAGVADVLLATHMGRTESAEGAERARGGTRLEDWMDAGWYLTKDKTGTRSLRAIGRIDEVPAFDLRYDMDEHTYTHSGRGRSDRKRDEAALAAVDAVAVVGEGKAKRHVLPKIPDSLRPSAIEEAQKLGWLEIHPGARNAQLCRLTQEGRRAHGRRIER